MRQVSVQIVWFKRDLRIADHAPLVEAAAHGAVLPLYVIECGYWREPDVSSRQLAFVRECLSELRERLAILGQPLVVRTGSAEEVLEEFRQRLPVAGLWSHEETGNSWTFARDRRVSAWARSHGIPWHERPQTGVIRKLASRDGWAGQWDRMMRSPPSRAPRTLDPVSGVEPGPISLPPLPDDGCPGRQIGGREAAIALLRTFLHERGEPYRRAMSTPGAGAVHCSRLSPHLACGTVSMREVLQAAEARLATESRPGWRASLASFTSRLRWHCHFMQKLESEPEIEFRSLHPAYRSFRRDDPDRFAAWAEGRTGWPFVDACMRMLQATGWLNFRMRAMLISVASYQLWLDWRATGLHLARLFTDYEPGIHWPQTQMQSGTTGINTLRIYNPVKQGRDQDADGAFIRRWCPELASVPLPWLHAPWTMPELDQVAARCAIGRDYPAPIVDHAATARLAREAVWGARREPGYASDADKIQDRHGSRRSGLPQPRRSRPQRQLALEL